MVPGILPAAIQLFPIRSQYFRCDFIAQPKLSGNRKKTRPECTLQCVRFPSCQVCIAIDNEAEEANGLLYEREYRQNYAVES
jgi:hypothetical protein